MKEVSSCKNIVPNVGLSFTNVTLKVGMDQVMTYFLYRQELDSLINFTYLLIISCIKQKFESLHNIET